MEPIRKRVLVDECNRPVAVQVDYEDWIRIMELLGASYADTTTELDLAPFQSSILLREDPLEYQARIRGEWDGQST